jgi:hypothetical protein
MKVKVQEVVKRKQQSLSPRRAYTRLTARGGEVYEHEGTSALTAVATRDENHVAVEMDFDVATKEELVALVGMLLVQIEELSGENTAAQCIAKYAYETGHVVHQEGQRDIAFIPARPSQMPTHD